ncbi:MAG: hypothetical protein KF745_02155 [Phycisphaeraceae bacterium]|nr:hypothetical protein [Phycisphaeraceae bacterium]
MTADPAHTYVGRGGLKLRFALDRFGVDVSGWTCADFGCNVGGFTDCLLQAGAASVVAVDTGYGTLAWRLRNDPRVRVMERANALHAAPPPGPGLDLVVIDMGWTPQRLCIPAALRWIGASGSIISLLKPHYEITKSNRSAPGGRGGVLDESAARDVVDRVVTEMPSLGACVQALARSPVQGGKGGNTEWLAWLRPAGSA